MVTPTKNTNVMWKIIIPNNKLNEFNYTYLAENINIGTSFDTGPELEILLNVGLVMRCISIETMTDYVMRKGAKCEYTLYTFEFMEYSKFYQKNFVKEMKDILKCLENI